MTDWINLLNSVNQKIIGIINSTKDSFTGDGVFENKERLGFLLKTAEEKKIKILDVGGVSTKPGFKEVRYEQELKRLNFFISNYFGKFKLSVDTMNYEIARRALENNFEIYGRSLCQCVQADFAVNLEQLTGPAESVELWLFN